MLPTTLRPRWPSILCRGTTRGSSTRGIALESLQESREHILKEFMEFLESPELEVLKSPELLTGISDLSAVIQATLDSREPLKDISDLFTDILATAQDTTLTGLSDLFTVVLIMALTEEEEEETLDAVAPGAREMMVHEGLEEDLEGLAPQSEGTALLNTADSSTIKPPLIFPSLTGRRERSIGSRKRPFTSSRGALSWRSSSCGPRGKRSPSPMTPCSRRCPTTTSARPAPRCSLRICGAF